MRMDIIANSLKLRFLDLKTITLANMVKCEKELSCGNIFKFNAILHNLGDGKYHFEIEVDMCAVMTDDMYEMITVLQNIEKDVFCEYIAIMKLYDTKYEYIHGTNVYNVYELVNFDDLRYETQKCTLSNYFNIENVDILLINNSNKNKVLMQDLRTKLINEMYSIDDLSAVLRVIGFINTFNSRQIEALIGYFNHQMFEAPSYSIEYLSSELTRVFQHLLRTKNYPNVNSMLAIVAEAYVRAEIEFGQIIQHNMIHERYAVYGLYIDKIIRTCRQIPHGVISDLFPEAKSRGLVSDLYHNNQQDFPISIILDNPRIFKKLNITHKVTQAYIMQYMTEEDIKIYKKHIDWNDVYVKYSNNELSGKLYLYHMYKYRKYLNPEFRKIIENIKSTRK